jgi:vacuolar-type H+-ATPase subunit C/Vma6
MKPTKYNTIMPRIALEELKLINLDELMSLIGKNLEEIYSFLTVTTYGEDITFSIQNIQGNEGEYVLLEDVLLQNYAKTFNRLLKDSSDYIENLLVCLLHKFDALNLKTMLRMVHAGINTKEILQNIIPLGAYSKEKCQAILFGANSISDVISSLQKQDFGFYLKEKLKTQMIFSGLSPLEATLDQEVFKGILEEINKLDRLDKKIATNILGIEIDVTNVKIILKCKALGINHAKIKENLMPVVLLDEKILESAIKKPDIKSTLQEFLSSIEKEHQIYNKIFLKLVKESDLPISHLEKILDKASLEMSLFELKKNIGYYNIGYILAFLNLKWTEIKNLRCIINATARNVPDQTKDLLILPENYNFGS